MKSYSDSERIALAAVWADEAACELAKALYKSQNLDDQTKIEVSLDRTMLDTLCDGLRTFSDTLFALNHPYPPAPVRSHQSVPIHHLRLVE